MDRNDYMLCSAPNGREFYMCGKRMFSCCGYGKDDKPIAFQEYKHWREMADDMEANGIDNPFKPFARDWG